MLVQGLKETFDEDYGNERYRNLYISLEYPSQREAFPGVWVDFEPTGQMEVIAIGGGNQYVSHTDETTGDEVWSTYITWKFQGLANFTITALGNLEFSRVFDEVAKVMAFGRERPDRNTFRSYIENNEFVAANFDFDQIAVGGFAQTPGTPWGGEEDVIWEGTISMEVVGEFNSDGATSELVSLKKIEVYPIGPGETDPTLAQPDTTQWV